MIRKSAAESLRLFGTGINALVLAVFAYLTFKLVNLASLHFAAGGAPPSMSLEGLKAFVALPDLRSKLIHWTLAWFFGIGAAGLGWMTLLGIRWAYHSMLRLLHR